MSETPGSLPTDPTPSPTPEPFDFEAWKAERVLEDCSDPTCIEFGLRGHLHWVLPEIGDKRNDVS